MGFFKKRREKREAQSGEIILQMLSGEEIITRDMALNIPSLAGCINFIANTIAMLPVELQKGSVIQKNDVRLRLLNSVTGDTLDAYQMKKAWITDMLLEGEGYIYIERKRNAVAGLRYVPSNKVSVMENTDPIFKDYDITVNGQKYRDFEFLKITRNTKNGASSRGIIEENNKILSVAYNAQEFENNLVRSGGKKGFIQAEEKLEKSVINDLKKQWKTFYTKNSENIVVLNKGVKFVEASLSSVEMQLKENKEANAIEICKIFNLSPEIIAGTCSDEEYNNGIKTAILPIIKSIETALNKDLLLESEYDKLSFYIDTKNLLKGDIEKRYKAYEIAVKNNFIQVDEIRELEGFQPLGLDFVKLGLNDVLYYPDSNTVYTPNTNKITSATSEKRPDNISEGGEEKNEN